MENKNKCIWLQCRMCGAWMYLPAKYRYTECTDCSLLRIYGW